MKIILSALVFVIISKKCFSQANEELGHIIKDGFAVIKKRVEKEIIPSRYMEGTLLLETDTLEGWQGFKVRLYKYKLSKETPETKVYILNANSGQIAKWIVSACYTASGSLTKKYIDILIKEIRNQSGGQFPVKGTVYENKGKPPYFFKDGVTVFLNKQAKQALNNHTADTLSVI